MIQSLEGKAMDDSPWEYPRDGTGWSVGYEERPHEGSSRDVKSDGDLSEE